MNPHPSTVKRQSGIVLIEVLVAVMIFSVGILAVIGLQATAIATVTDAKLRVDASTVAERRIGEIWATQAGLAAGTTTASVPELPSGTMTTTVAGSAAAGWAVTLVVTWMPPNSTTQRRFETVARVYGS